MVTLTYVLAAAVLGRGIGVGVAALAAVQPGLVDNAHRGLSDELFLTSLLLLLIAFLRIKPSSEIGWGPYGLLGLVGGVAALVRPDGAYVFLPIFVMFVWRERRQGLSKLARTLPVLVIPLALPFFSGMWTETLGFQSMNLRLGRVILWMEFMVGRMPFSYCLYKETHVNEWLLAYHTFGELVTLGLKSSIRNLLALGEAIWGQAALLLALLGIVAYVRRHREWALPLAIPLAVLPQWGIIALWAEEDVQRYATHVVPLLLIFLALGARQLAAWISARLTVDAPMTRLLPIGIVLLFLSPALLPYSLYTHVRPTVDILMTERQYLPKSREIHAELVAIWTELAAGPVPLSEPIRRVAKLRARHDAYAPTHFMLGVLHNNQGQRIAAIKSLERALEIVPFFAEAAVLLAEIYTMEDRREEALTLIRQTAILRSDYPLIELMRGHLHIMAGDVHRARTAYMEYLRLNRYQHERAFMRNERVAKREGMDTAKLQQARAALTTEEGGLTSRFLWGYLGLGLDGIDLAPPSDQTVYLNLGACDRIAGDVNAALYHWMAMTRLTPANAEAWANLGTLQAELGHHDQARTSWVQALAAAPDHAIALEGLRQLDAATFRAETARYAALQVILPMTRVQSLIFQP